MILSHPLLSPVIRSVGLAGLQYILVLLVTCLAESFLSSVLQGSLKEPRALEGHNSSVLWVSDLIFRLTFLLE